MISNADFFNTVEDDDFTEYKNMISSGEFYEIIMEKVSEFDIKITRDEAKILIFYTIYSSNRLPDNPLLRKMREVFNQMFPKVVELFKIIKREFKIFKEIKEIEGKQHNKLACLLQHIESKIILHRCCKRVWEEGNQHIPVFTNHDSIVTTINNRDYVASVMREELTRAIGLPPALDMEIWGEEVL